MTPIQELIEEYERKVGHCTELMSEQKENSTSFRRILAKRSAYKQIVQSLRDSLEKEKQEIINAFNYFGDKLEQQAKDYIILGDYDTKSFLIGEDYYNSKYKTKDERF